MPKPNPARIAYFHELDVALAGRSLHGLPSKDISVGNASMLTAQSSSNIKIGVRSVPLTFTEAVLLPLLLLPVTL